jgi:L-lactate dehydrogenase complex protein LldG
MSARDAVLQRIRLALGPDRSVVQVPRTYRRKTEHGLDVLVDRLEDYRAVVHWGTETNLPEVLGQVATGRVVVPAGVPESGQAHGDVVRDDGLPPAQLDELDAVLTTCAVAVAETGTIVLDAGPGQGRRALTLVPDHHVVVVRADQVVGSVPEALGLLDARRPQTWISGPSATSDIELQRVEGVHGPRRLEVVLLKS